MSDRLLEMRRLAGIVSIYPDRVLPVKEEPVVAAPEVAAETPVAIESAPWQKRRLATEQLLRELRTVVA